MWLWHTAWSASDQHHDWHPNLWRHTHTQETGMSSGRSVWHVGENRWSESVTSDVIREKKDQRWLAVHGGALRGQGHVMTDRFGLPPAATPSPPCGGGECQWWWIIQPLWWGTGTAACLCPACPPKPFGKTSEEFGAAAYETHISSVSRRETKVTWAEVPQICVRVRTWAAWSVLEGAACVEFDQLVPGKSQPPR